eukprot:TRINITY_DN12801_c0_g1_i4.p1 TRINITY_DN12801_c0_g1~~TRINITY_DN12801_c0_g1_i4.p1  ORF type:complete len:243 (-),score=50.39 TRINITY_DN12801_c0_g1_i4:118-846(-)
MKMDEHMNAFAYQKEALKLWEQLRKSKITHFYGISLNNLAQTYKKRQDYDVAYFLIRYSYYIFLQLYGNKNPHSNQAYQNLQFFETEALKSCSNIETLKNRLIEKWKKDDAMMEKYFQPNQSPFFTETIYYNNDPYDLILGKYPLECFNSLSPEKKTFLENLLNSLIKPNQQENQIDIYGNQPSQMEIEKNSSQIEKGTSQIEKGSSQIEKVPLSPSQHIDIQQKKGENADIESAQQIKKEM